ncbi:MAG TPA: M48 family metalloprotease [Vicinamibacteria bacterium]|nr:M48 family metalloprotease [Vicinamibacteria bacterium]
MRLWVCCISCLILVAALAFGQERDPADEAKIYEALVSVAPEAVSDFRSATEAMDTGDRETAEIRYRAVLVRAPDFVPALRRLSYVAADDEEALVLGRRAYELDNHAYNLMAVLEALLRFQEYARLREASDLAERLIGELPEDPVALQLVAMAALRTENRELLRRATSGLRQVDPDNVGTHYFSGIEAAIDGDWERAEAEVEQARALGLSDEEAERLLSNAGIRDRARNWRYVRYAGFAALGWASGLVLLTVVGIVLSKLTLHTIEGQSPQLTGDPDASVRIMRRLYQFALAVTSFYFYLSVPFVFLLVFGVGGGLIYALLALGYLPVKLLIIALVLMVVTTWAMLKGLFARREDADPGERIAEQDAPALFSVLREVAEKVRTPMVDTVFAVPDARVAVFERGSTLAHLRHRGERCLLLGLGVLEGMRLSQLKAILAHEYGHLSNRDTAGGELALQVRRSITSSAETMAVSGAATWYNPAWLFLNLFLLLYLRISHGASRLQEVLADRWAVLAYGKRAFADGLRHAVRRAVEFDFLTNNEIHQALREGRALANLYRLDVPLKWNEGAEHSPEAKSPADAIENAYQEALSAVASPYDSHPPPNQRIAWVEKVTGAPEFANEDRDAWSLFPDRAKFEERMTAQVHENVQAMLAQQELYEQQMAEAQDGDEITSIGNLRSR